MHNPTRILLVEDDVVLARMYRQMLEHAGFQVVHAADGLEAWELLHHLVKPDLIITDLSMPKLSGDQLLTQIRQTPQLEHLKVCVFTNNQDALMEQRIRDLKPVAYLNKLEFASHQFVHTIQQLVAN